VQCHTRYSAGSGSGHTDSGDDIFAFRHNTLTISCVTCHVGHGTSAAMTGAAGAVEWPDDTTAPSGDERSSLLRVNNRAVCVNCHVVDGEVTSGSCDGCHGAPPTSGAHLSHSSPDVVGYGMVGVYNDASSYRFGCGECHSTDSSAHQNGTVDLDFNPATAPAGSLKANNSPTAAFDGTSCGGVYCHSGEQVTSGAVGNPLKSGGSYILDAYRNLTYAPYVVNSFRVYATTPAWEGGSVSNACTECHSFPLTTSVPNVSAGVGDGHQWVDDWGYGNLHAYNMSWPALSCSTCHYGEIVAANTTTRSGMDVTSYNPVPLNDRSVHVNGLSDVTFTPDPIVYRNSMSLSGASYNSADRSCANVACHLNQTYVVWGTPYRWWTDECDLCHRYGSIPLMPSATGLAPVFESGSSVHPAADPFSANCAECHPHTHGR
jgi:predicted CxxxxCH...CXXCH cytochrome family protein